VAKGTVAKMVATSRAPHRLPLQRVAGCSGLVREVSVTDHAEERREEAVKKQEEQGMAEQTAVRTIRT